MIPAAREAPVASPLRPRRRWWIAGGGVVAALLLVAAAGVGLWPRPARGPSAPATALDPERVVVAVFANRTGEASLETLGLQMSDWVTQSLFRMNFRVAVNPEVPSPGGPGLPRSVLGAERDPLRALAECTGAGLVVSGAYYLDGDQVRVQGQLIDAATGAIAVPFSPAIGPRSQPGSVVTEVARVVMGALAIRQGRGAITIGTGEIRPPAYDAYVEWVRGMEVWDGEHGGANPEPYMRRSLQLDPNFLVSRVTLWHSMVGQARYQEADDILRPLETPAILAQLTPYERAFARFMRAFLDGDWTVQLAAIREAARLVPTPWTLYQWGVTERRARRPHAALEALSRIRAEDTPAELGTQTGFYMHYRAMVHHQLGSYDEELEDARLGQRQYPADGWIYVDEVGALVGLGRLTELEAVITRAERAALRSGSVGHVLYRASRELDVHGHTDAARAMAARAAAWYVIRARTVTPTRAFRQEHANALINGGDCQRGVAIWQALAQEAPDNLLYRGRHATARLVCGGNRAEARRMAEAFARADRPFLHGLHLFQSARLLAALGDGDAAVRALHASYARGWGFGHDDLHADYAWMPILHHPGFQAWLKTTE